MSKKIVLHGHIFKNAGTTIDWILERNFPHSYCDNREDFKIRSEPTYLTEFLYKNPHIRALSSHSLPLPLAIESENFDFFTMVMLRHPLLRVRSVYDFERKQVSSTPGAVHAKKYSFREYVDWRMKPNVAPTIRDMQVRYLTQTSCRKSEQLNDLHYRAALSYLKENMLIGIVDEFDWSMVVFDHYLSEHDVEIDFSYKKQNVSREKQFTKEKKLEDSLEELRRDLGEPLYSKLLHNNQMDLKVHDVGKKLLKERFESIPEHKISLEKLRRKCSQLDHD